jgi:hypothetical protein
MRGAKVVWQLSSRVRRGDVPVGPYIYKKNGRFASPDGPKSTHVQQKKIVCER